MKQLRHFGIRTDKWGKNMPYQVEIYNKDETPDKRWQPTTFTIRGYNDLKREYEDNNITRYDTDSREEAEATLMSMKGKGWKARIKKI